MPSVSLITIYVILMAVVSHDCVGMATIDEGHSEQLGKMDFIKALCATGHIKCDGWVELRQ